MTARTDGPYNPVDVFPRTFGPRKPRTCPRCQWATVIYIGMVTLVNHPALGNTRPGMALRCSHCGSHWYHCI